MQKGWSFLSFLPVTYLPHTSQWTRLKENVVFMGEASILFIVEKNIFYQPGSLHRPYSGRFPTSRETSPIVTRGFPKRSM